MTPSTLESITDYYTDAWTYGLCDFETPESAFFKVNDCDRDAFPELALVFAVKVEDRKPLRLFPDASTYVAAVAEEAGR